MKKYNVEIVETLSRVVEVNANSYELAEELAEKQYDDEKIILDWNDKESVEFKSYPSEKIKNDFFLEISYDKKNNNLVIGTENSSGASYNCKTKQDLLFYIKSYIDDYVDFEKIKPIQNLKLER